MNTLGILCAKQLPNTTVWSQCYVSQEEHRRGNNINQNIIMSKFQSLHYFLCFLRVDPH